MKLEKMKFSQQFERKWQTFMEKSVK